MFYLHFIATESRDDTGGMTTGNGLGGREVGVRVAIVARFFSSTSSRSVLGTDGSDVLLRFSTFVFTLGVVTGDCYNCKQRHLAHFTTLITTKTHERGCAKRVKSASLMARKCLWCLCNENLQNRRLLNAERISIKRDIGNFLQNLCAYSSFGLKSYINDYFTWAPTCASA